MKDIKTKQKVQSIKTKDVKESELPIEYNRKVCRLPDSYL